MDSFSFASQGAGCLVFRDDQVLLVKLNYGSAKGHWILPGGMVEKNETPHLAALRELKEETGLNGKVISKVSVRHRIDAKGNTNIYWVFNCQITSPKETSLTWPREELQEVKFWPLKQALKASKVKPMTQLFIDLGLKKIKEKIITKSSPARTDIIYT